MKAYSWRSALLPDGRVAVAGDGDSGVPGCVTIVPSTKGARRVLIKPEGGVDDGEARKGLLGVSVVGFWISLGCKRSNKTWLLRGEFMVSVCIE